MPDYSVSYNFVTTRGNGFGDTTFSFSLPMTGADMDMIRKMLASNFDEELQASIVIMSIFQLAPEGRAPASMSDGEKMLRQRLSDLARSLKNDNDRWTRTGSWNAARELKAILDGEGA